MISVNLSSLRSDALLALATLGLLPSVADGDEEHAAVEKGVQVIRQGEGALERRGQPWFEELIEGSELGRIRRRRGVGTSADGKTVVEWEVVEFNGEESGETPESGTGTGKRKHGDDMAEEDTPMRDGY